MPEALAVPMRRRVLGAAAIVVLSAHASRWVLAAAEHPNRSWYEAAEAMRQLALTWGDQPFGAVIVLNGAVAGQGPSRVVKNNDPDAHAEREALRDAQRRLGRWELTGAVMYSTSRPCRLCEEAAARANVSRMYFGAELNDAGPPKPSP